MSIKKTVVLRSEVYTVYSSEQQERMKVYFELNEKFQKCMETCPKQDEQLKEECEKRCDKIFDDYVPALEQRYQENKEKLDEVVTGAPSYTSRLRKDRRGFFYGLFGMSLSEAFGTDNPEPALRTQHQAANPASHTETTANNANNANPEASASS